MVSSSRSLSTVLLEGPRAVEGRTAGVAGAGVVGASHDRSDPGDVGLLASEQVRLNASTAVLRVGLRIVHDGQVFTVVEISGSRMLLEPGVVMRGRSTSAGCWLIRRRACLAETGRGVAGRGAVGAGRCR